ncbi:MAG: glycosyltransferase [Acidobacteria bacterium]|nr:glycosyltransferase [Acidobacteriota bacterium]
MAREVEVEDQLGLTDYEAYPHLATATLDLRTEAAELVPHLKGRTIWMVNSTAQGGGVAEMLPKVVSLLREVGADVRWLVIEAHDEEFFTLTKRIHNLIHGVGEPLEDSSWREVYEKVSRENAASIAPLLSPGDILLIHDPQPLGTGAMLLAEHDLIGIWRCHIGLDQRNAATDSAWNFLKPWLAPFRASVFSAPEYIPDFLAHISSIIHPAIDPLSHKNRDLTPHKLQGILCNASLAIEHEPVLTPPYEHLAKRLGPEGEWLLANEPEDIGLLSRPIVTQISRWDRLKGFVPLLEAFVKLKMKKDGNGNPLHQRRREISRLVLAGPDPASVADDPEGLDVVRELADRYMKLDPRLQKDIALISLPMESRRENALMVNALQLCASVVVQNSIQEGFGLTVTEAMWKRRVVVGSRACGIRQQIREGIDGRLVESPTDTDHIADVLDSVLADPYHRDYLASHAERRVHEEFLVFSQLRKWLRLLVQVVHRAR